MSAWAAPGSTVVVAVRQSIAEGWHTYWRNPGDSGGATTLEWRLPPGVEAGPILWPLPTRQRLMSLVNYGYSGEVFLPVTLSVPASARVGSTLDLSVEALFLVCSDRMCVPEPLTLNLALPVRDGAAPLTRPWGAAIQQAVEAAPRPAAIAARATRDGERLILSATGGALAGEAIRQAWFFPYDGDAIDHAAPQSGQAGPDGVTLTLTPRRAGDAPLSGVLATDRGAWEITAEAGPALPGASGGATLRPWSDDAGEPTNGGGIAVLQALGLALLGGLVLNLMPCVFPVLAMKAAALSAAAHDPRRARRDGLAFVAGVLLTFLLLAGLLLALRAGGAAIGWGFQLQSPAVVAGLSLLMLAVALNLSGVFHMGAGLQALGAGRWSGHHAGGAFLTGALAVVVAAPCTAPFMAAALGAALVMPWPAALAVFLALGLGLGLPYLLVSLSPGLLKRLPRPGPWMERLKQVLALPMYAAAAWLLWVFARQSGQPALILLLAGSLAVAGGLWLSGRLQTRRAQGRRTIGAGVAAVAALALGVGLAGVAASQARPPAVSPSGPLHAQPWSPQAVREAQGSGRPVLVNFTADWCVTCKINERAALSSREVSQALEAANGVYLVADWTRRDDAITRELEARGRSGVPLYLLYPGGGGEPRVLPQLLTEGSVVDALKGARGPPRPTPAARAGR
ncbi:thioredoxin family protein [Brevundimonas sp. PAMC22021]|nr:thioredoxin family protein [Brevundimonas sp. PAMC22021]QYF88411.1 thioredoxin family protein [Brevundimonas sp. PAMC22021]